MFDSPANLYSTLLDEIGKYRNGIFNLAFDKVTI